MAEDGNWPDEVKPLDVDGVGAVAAGTLLWLVALIVLLFFREDLADSGSEWWIWVAAAGFGLGLPGLWYTRRRRSVYRAAGDKATDSDQ